MSRYSLIIGYLGAILLVAWSVFAKPVDGLESRGEQSTPTTTVYLPSVAVQPRPTPTPDEFHRDLPNILLIITDDLSQEMMEYLPLTKAAIFEQGVDFSRAYIANPLCCPSRASILTGLDSFRTNVHMNQDVLAQKSVVEVLDRYYHTGLIGRYLNSVGNQPRPEFDQWVAFRAEGYENPILNVNGVESTHKGYITEILHEFALSFFSEAQSLSAPFFLIYSTYAPHAPGVPSKQDEGLFTDLPDPASPSINEDISDKPLWIQQSANLDKKYIQARLEQRLGMYTTLPALDRSIDGMLQRLDEMGQLDNTFVIFLSDNGYLHGEHYLYGKVHAYEESVKVPFGIRYPPISPISQTISALVSNLDIAPTIYELTNISPPYPLSGRSLLSLIEEPDTSWRENLILAGWYDVRSYLAVVTDRYKYIETSGDWSEFYDLKNDPFEIANLAEDQAYSSQINDLKSELQLFRQQIPPHMELNGPWYSQSITNSFTASIRQISVTVPISVIYEWRIVPHIVITQTGGISNSITFQWNEGGAKLIEVAALINGVRLQRRTATFVSFANQKPSSLHTMYEYIPGSDDYFPLR